MSKMNDLNVLNDVRWTSSAGDRALVTGATGLVGRALLPMIGDHAIAATRYPARARGLSGEVVGWDATSPVPAKALARVGAIFHLAGEPVAEGRWTAAKKARIQASRIESTRSIVESIAKLAPADRPRVLVCASAVGIYGSRGDELLDESAPLAEGFLAEVCLAWEAEAARAKELGVRVVSLRIGIVLSPSGGALPKMLRPFRLGLGATLGDGAQWMPWIHVDDVVGLLRFVAGNEAVEGPVNAVAPGVVSNKDFTQALGRALHRRIVLSAPKFALALALGEVSSVVLASQRVVPKRALDAGFEFAYPNIDEALAACLRGDEIEQPTRRAQ